MCVCVCVYVCRSYSQFLFALLRLAEKRGTGFQEVVSCIIRYISAVPAARQADLLVFRNTGAPEDLAEHILRPRHLPQLEHVNEAQAQRLQREAELAKTLKQKPKTVERKGFDKNAILQQQQQAAQQQQGQPQPQQAVPTAAADVKGKEEEAAKHPAKHHAYHKGHVDGAEGLETIK